MNLVGGIILSTTSADDSSRHSIPKTLARAIRTLSQIKVSGKERQALIGDDAIGCRTQLH